MFHLQLKGQGCFPVRQFSQGLAQSIIKVSLVSLHAIDWLQLTIVAERGSCRWGLSFFIFRNHAFGVCTWGSFFDCQFRLSKSTLLWTVFSHEWLGFLLDSQLGRVIERSLGFFSLVFCPAFAESTVRRVSDWYIGACWGELLSSICHFRRCLLKSFGWI